MKRATSRLSIPFLPTLGSHNHIVNSLTTREKLVKLDEEEESQNDNSDFELISTQPAKFVKAIDDEVTQALNSLAPSPILGHSASTSSPVEEHEEDPSSGESGDEDEHGVKKTHKKRTNLKKSATDQSMISKFSHVHDKVKAIASIQLAGKLRRKELNQKVKLLSEAIKTSAQNAGMTTRDLEYEQYLREKVEVTPIEDEIDQKIKLEDIRLLFENSSEDGLTETQFIDGMSRLLGEGRANDELKALFARIDANANGRIDWNEFSTYVLLGYEGAKKMKQNLDDKLFVHQTFPDVNTKSMYHKGRIVKILQDEKRNRYYTAGTDGLVKSWFCDNFLYDRNIYYTPHSMISDIEYLSVHDELCICTIDRVVNFYDLDTLTVRRAFKGKYQHSSGVEKSYGPFESSEKPSLSSASSSLMPTTSSLDISMGGSVVPLLYNNESFSGSDKRLTSSLPNIVKKGKEVIEIVMPDHLKDPNPVIETLYPLPPNLKIHKQIEHLKNELFTKPFGLKDTIPVTILEDFIDAPTCMTDFSKYCMSRQSKQQDHKLPLLDHKLPLLAQDYVGKPQKQGMEVFNPCHIMFGMDSGFVQLYDCSAPIGRSPDCIRPERKWKLHDSWVSKIIYAPSIDCIITSSFDTTICVTNFGDGKRGRLLRGHTKEIYSMDWCEKYKLLASCSRDKEVRLWNPFISNPLVTLYGHEKPIVDVKFNLEDRQIITLDTGKTIKVWDMRNYKLLQTINDASNSKNPCSTMLYNPKKSSIITASNKLKMFPMKRTLTDFAKDFKGHRAPITACLYNETLKQLITCDESLVCVWDVTTGKLIFKFLIPNKISTAILDVMKRRLIVSSHNGEVSLWNYINGQKLMVCFSPPLSDQLIDYSNNNNNTSTTTTPFYSSLASHATTPITQYRYSSNHSATLSENSHQQQQHHRKVHSISSLDYKGLGFVYKESRGIKTIVAGGNNKKLVFWKDSDDKDAILEEHAMCSQPFARDINVVRCYGDYIAIGLDNGVIYTLDDQNGEIKGSTNYISIPELRYDSFYKQPPKNYTGKDKIMESTNHLSQPTQHSSIEDLLFLPKKDGLLLSSRANGIISFWEVSKNAIRHLYSFKTTPQNEFITCLSTSASNETLVLGDSRGFIFVYDLSCIPKTRSNSSNSNSSMANERASSSLSHTSQESSDSKRYSKTCEIEKRHVRLVKTFKAHTESVSSIAYISPNNLIASCGADCTAVLFDLYGIPIGFFGQRLEWKLGLTFTYGRQDFAQFQNVINLDLDLYKVNEEDEEGNILSTRGGGGKSPNPNHNNNNNNNTSSEPAHTSSPPSSHTNSRSSTRCTTTSPPPPLQSRLSLTNTNMTSSGVALVTTTTTTTTTTNTTAPPSSLKAKSPSPTSQHASTTTPSMTQPVIVVEGSSSSSLNSSLPKIKSSSSSSAQLSSPMTMDKTCHHHVRFSESPIPLSSTTTNTSTILATHSSLDQGMKSTLNTHMSGSQKKNLASLLKQNGTQQQALTTSSNTTAITTNTTTTTPPIVTITHSSTNHHVVVPPSPTLEQKEQEPPRQEHTNLTQQHRHVSVAARYQKLRDLESKVAEMIDKTFKEQGISEGTTPRDQNEAAELAARENNKAQAERKAIEKFQKTLLWSQAHESNWIDRVRSLIDVDDDDFEKNMDDFMIIYKKQSGQQAASYLLHPSSNNMTHTSNNSSNSNNNNSSNNIVSSSTIVVEPTSIMTMMNASQTPPKPPPLSLDKLPLIHNSHPAMTKTHSLTTTTSTLTGHNTDETMTRAKSEQSDRFDKDFEKKMSSLFSSLELTLKEVDKLLI
ncbi:hypothetical protein C9374_008408 [Naegleria lovaniensis]|uniref:EF-hand domain-containing protein n=1 Tax=Naegleria lovaniensis TaxID=51637 RepID=A0AA88KG26_NAELO|nr:uncharacterized protein C9374_008408 [Naegleria lovaniensis]KAG2378265.1 hypothetical protein C9374_008408 [Naegleria lovaniensis]